MKPLTFTQIMFLAAAKRHGGLFWNGHEQGWVGYDRAPLTEAEAEPLYTATTQTAKALAKRGLVESFEHPAAYPGTIVWKAI